MNWLSRFWKRSENTTADLPQVYPFLATIHLRSGKQYLQAFAARSEAQARLTVQGWLKDGLTAEAPANTFRRIEPGEIEKIELKTGEADHE